MRHSAKTLYGLVIAFGVNLVNIDSGYGLVPVQCQAFS